MRRYNLHILGVSECRWTGSGKMKTDTGETVLYSGREDNHHFEGVAIILKKGTEKVLIEWKPVNSRLITAKLKGVHTNMTLIQCYAPTNDSDEAAKDTFYEQLQAEVRLVPRHDLLVVMGDLNAKVGNNNTDMDRIIGEHGCGTINDNGERLVELCAAYNLVVGGTLFPHQDIHKLTWCSPNGRDKNQIDHLMINGTWRRSLLDVKVKRGADVGSDHHLVTANIKMKLRSTGRKTLVPTRYDIEKLQDHKVKNAVILQLKNKFQALTDNPDIVPSETTEVNTKWDQIRTIYETTSQDCLGFKQGKKMKKWITPGTWKVIEERRHMNKKILDTKSERLQERHKAAYRVLDKNVKRMARADKRAYMEDLAKQAEEAAEKGEQGKIYKITREICGKFRSNNDVHIKDKNGRLLTTENEQKARWAEHFQEVLNRPAPDEEAIIIEALEDLEINTNLPERQEIITAIKALKNGKSPGQDNLNAELFKVDPELAAEILQSLFTSIWKGKIIPDDWTKGIIIKLAKKGALSDCNNWRDSASICEF
ncbi:uncharacterized protein LOC143074119 [Mytilus galloprovincialis]|uniref:uncharacterized protein LOC143074119 n=1 Tax=Mytilus galloprovincialis TaxID=29158 RepID=UPI003F7C6F26